jgi:glycosyltransferase involved in cell wall biosynthesis
MRAKLHPHCRGAGGIRRDGGAGLRFQPVRIAQITATFPPYRGGTGNVAYEYSRRLAERGHEVEVFTAATPGEPPDPGGALVHRIDPLLAIGNAPLIPSLARRLRGFDVLHLHHPFIFGSEPALWAHARSPDAALVVTHHNRLIGRGGRRPLFWMYEETLGRALARRADRVCVLSRAQAETVSYLASALRRDRSRVAETPNGVDVELFAPRPADPCLRERFGIPAGAPLALFAGALDRAHWFKRLDLAIDALARGEDPSLRLLVVGGGESLERFRALAAQAGVGERVHFADAQPHDALPAFLRAADFLVLPSSDLESFGMVLIEAMACGTPVVATDLPGPAAVVRDGETGLIARRGDAGDLAAKVERMLDAGPEGRARMGAAGREDVVGRFAWPAVIDRVEAAYDAAIAVRRRNFRA